MHEETLKKSDGVLQINNFDKYFNTSKTFLQVILVAISNRTYSICTNALADTSLDATLLIQENAQKLNLKRITNAITINNAILKIS